MVGFWSFLAVFGWYSSTILRVYLTFQFLSAHPTVLFSADGSNTVQGIFARYIARGLGGTLHKRREASKGDFGPFVRCCFGPRIPSFIGFSAPREPFLGRS